MLKWHITNGEWKKLREFFECEQLAELKPGRPRTGNARAVVEACLFHHYHSLSQSRNSFGWNELPKEFGVSPSTANRRYREWTASGVWGRFWDALLLLRHGPVEPPVVNRSHVNLSESSLISSSVQQVIGELERAFCFFNARFYANSLPNALIITLDTERASRKLGFFCNERWGTGRKRKHHIAVTTASLGKGKAFALQVLLHEMVHYRNHLYGLKDCSRSQYHNAHFRDTALLGGLACVGFTKAKGYANTCLSPRGQEAIMAFEPSNAHAFDWPA